MLGSARRAVRLGRFLYRQRIIGFEVPDQPHFDDASTQWFLDRLALSRMYLEFGSGGSTLVAAAKGIPTISVESDRFFSRAVRRRLPDGAPLQTLVANIGLTREWGTPVFSTPTRRRVRRWRRYIELPFARIRQMGDGFPDLVLVDGRFRRACALESARQAAEAGAETTVCIDDYGDRPYLAEVEQFIGRPTLHGRMAVFEIDPGRIRVPRGAVEEAIQDCR